MNWVKKTRIDFLNEVDKEIIHKNQALIPKYIELKHQEQINAVKDNYVMIQRFKISIDGDWTCPAKTVAIFAHNFEFSFQEEMMPALVRTVSEQCKTIQNVSELIRSSVLPSAISGTGK